MNLKSLFGKRPTTKSDVIMAITGAAMAAYKAFDTYNEYKAEKKKALNEGEEK